MMVDDMQKKIMMFIFWVFIFNSCTPNENQKTVSCVEGKVFDEFSKVCVLSELFSRPATTTTMISLNENTGENTFAIEYTDLDGDDATGCFINSVNSGMRAVIDRYGIIYKAKSNFLDGIYYTLNFITGGSYGLESISTSCSPAIPFCTFTISIENGVTTAQNIANVINNDLVASSYLDLTVTSPYQIQYSASDLNFDSGRCSCINGDCTLIVEPAIDFTGLVYIDYHLADKDGYGNTKRLTAVVNNVDTAPIANDITNIVALEDQAYVINLPYTDVDIDNADICIVSNLNSNLTEVSSCFCSSGVCQYSMRGISNYFNITSFHFFDFVVIANNNTSNFASASGIITAVSDTPTVNSTQNFTVIEDTTNSSYFTSSFSFLGGNDSDGDNLTYHLSSISSGASVTNCLDASSNISSCSLIIPKDFNGLIQITYFASDGSNSSSIGILNFTVISQDDPPFHTSLSEINFSNNIESSNLDPSTYILSLIQGSDEEDSIEDLKYFLWDNVSSTIIYEGAGENGLLANCMGLNNSSQTDFVCDYTPNDGNTSGINVDSYYYIIQDSSVNNSINARKFIINISEISDIPTACQYSQYNYLKERTECGTRGCIGEGAPDTTLSPSSHLANDPVVYYDEKNGICYTSSSTTSWSIVSTADFHSYIKSSINGDREKIIIDNIILNEGGDMEENFEEIVIDTSSVTVSSSNSSLIATSNITFKYYDMDNNLITSFKGDSNSIESLDPDTGDIDAATGKLRIEVIPTVLEIGNAEISFQISDGTNNSIIKTNIEIIPHSMNHEGWSKVKSVGIKTSRNTPIEKNLSCPLSMDKCANSVSGLNGSISLSAGSKVVAGVGTNFTTSLEVGNYIVIAGEVNQVLSIVSNTVLGISVSQKTAVVGGSISKVNEMGICSSSDFSDPSIPATVGAIFRNATGNCYYRNNKSNWIKFYPYCDITEVKSENAQSIGIIDGITDVDSSNTCDTELRSGTCIGDGTPDEVGISSLENAGVFYFNTNELATDDKKCWLNRGGTWSSYSSSTEVIIGWEDFTIFGGGSINGYNIYRKITGELFDYDKPINRERVSAIQKEYIDNGLNSINPPVPNTVYFYEVKPVLNINDSEELEVSSSIESSKVRIISPPDNMVFAHRWMLNKNICAKMFEPYYKDDNYICSYLGLGDTETPIHLTSTYTGPSYDIGNDLLINRFEVGCPYDINVCISDGAIDGTCISNDLTLTASSLSNEGKFFYNRSTGNCYVNDGNGNWSIPSVEELINNRGVSGMSAYLPPLVNVDVSDMSGICVAQAGLVPEDIFGINGSSLGKTNSSFSLPTKIQQVAYSQWEQIGNSTYASINILEEGLSLNSSSKCNSSNANGLTDNYINLGIPSFEIGYSLPGTNLSQIRSFHTGSVKTALCESVFGVQDHVGNVAEVTANYFLWDDTIGRFNSSNFNSNGVSIGVASYDGGGLTDYANDDLTGVCVDHLDSKLVMGTCTEDNSSVFLPEFFLGDTTYTDRILLPLGLPIADDFLASTSPETLEILGVPPYTQASEFHYDRIDFNQIDFSGGGNSIGHVVVGGSFSNGIDPSVKGFSLAEGAGVYAFELIKNETSRFDIGLRCLIQIPETDYIE